MTFEQAAEQFARSEAAYRAGQIDAAALQAAAAQYRVTDPQGRIWQIDPASRQWLCWNGHAWSPAASAPVAPASSGGARWSGLGASLTAVLPGIGVDVMQRWPVYRQDPAAALSVAGPGLATALLPPLASAAGRWVALTGWLGCVAWLVWPVATQMLAGGDPLAAGAKQELGRGIVAISQLSLLGRIWKAR